LLFAQSLARTLAAGTTCDDLLVMKRAQVSELKARLSEFLAGVRAGGDVVVYDRVTPIARIVPYDAPTEDDLEIIEPSAPPSSLHDLTPVRMRRRIDVDRILRESRGER
jgi:prevent-host-death family protein